MLKIDRLLIRARKEHAFDMLLTAFICPAGHGKWMLNAQLWNGKPGNGVKVITCVCNSIKDAQKTLDELSEKYPNNKNVPVFIDDLD